MTEIVWQVCRWFLVAVFAIAGVTKLIDRDRTRSELAEIGLPKPNVAAWLVPLVELNVAGALYAFPAWGGVAAFVLLVAFTTTLVSIIRSGRTVSCACFGAIASGTVTKSQVYRNLALLAQAGIVAALAS